MKAARKDLMKSFVRSIHFVGIGGVGMSGIAEVLNNLGYKVSGSDLKSTETTRRLQGAGVRVYEGHAASHAAGAQVVVVSSAIADNNPETAYARKHGIPVVLRAQMLAELGRMKKTVTIAGSHGKTTTTSLVSMALKEAGAGPTMIIGGQLKNIQSNAKLGVGEYLVAEADESDGSFLFLTPLVAVVTNIDNDHMDHYKTMDALKDAFVSHLLRLPFYGAAVLCADDPNVRAIMPRLSKPILTYGFTADADLRALGVKAADGKMRFSAVSKNNGGALQIELNLPGLHNVSNALAVIAVGREIGVSDALIAKGTSKITNIELIERGYEDIIGKLKGIGAKISVK